MGVVSVYVCSTCFLSQPVLILSEGKSILKVGGEGGNIRSENIGATTG